MNEQAKPKTSDEAKRMRCPVFSKPTNCVGDGCMRWAETHVIDVETGEHVIDVAGKDVIRFGKCGPA